MGFTHAPPHATVPNAHRHVPPEQIWLPEHARPHIPQLLVSKLVLVHVPEQLTAGDVHVPHRPRLQACPAGHMRPHAPQLFGSELGFTHVSPHMICATLQRPHAPPEQA